jgi:glycosyltransferase involved in cell wall biosynthesis
MEIVINGRFLTQQITGVQRYAHELLVGLDASLDGKAPIGITVLSPRLSAPPPVWRNIKLREVGSLQGHAWEQMELPFYSRGKVLFCPGNTSPLFSIFGSQRVVVTIHDLSYRYFPAAYSLPFRLWYNILVPAALRRANAVITVSNAEYRAIGAIYPEAAPRLHAIANGGLPVGFDVDDIEVPTEQGGYILYVGSLSKRKNFAGAFEVACRLARKRGFRFVFIGGSASSIAKFGFTIPPDLAAFIDFKGQVDDPRVLSGYYRGAACLLFPSLYESSGLPPIEAMACGCPVIVSDIPALKERCGDAAVYCDPYDIASIVSAVERLMDDGALRDTLRRAGYQRAAVYSWKNCAEQTLQLLQDVAR